MTRICKVVIVIFFSFLLFEESLQNVLSSRDTFVSGCGVPNNLTGFIYSGTQVERGSFPWIVAIFRKNSNGLFKYICGGTLVSANKVITAAHCIHNKNDNVPTKAKNLMLHFGAHNLNMPDEYERVTSICSEVIINEDWDPKDLRFNDDIAILLIDKDLKFTQFIKPICMWPNEEILNAGEGFVVGWGKSEDASKVHEEIPKVLKLPITSNEKCYRENSLLSKIAWEKSFCAGKPGVGVCRGDSGGGFFIKWKGVYYLKGIVSSGVSSDVCQIKDYSIFTDVVQYLDFIEEMEKYTALKRIEGPSCTLPNSTITSTCVLVYNCSYFDDFIKRIKTQTATSLEKQEIKKYSCESSRYDVCCPDYAKKSIQTLQRHQNFRLINDRKCGTTESRSRIAGGWEAELFQYPWIVLLWTQSYVSTELEFVCLGSLISRSFVLTAAHCVSRRLISVRLGEHRISTEFDGIGCGSAKCLELAEEIPVEKRIRHEGYRRPIKQHDIALLKLARPADLSKKNVNTICLPTVEGSQLESLNPEKLERMTIMGWGITENGNASDVFMTANLPYVPYNDCVEVYKPIIKEILEGHFCAGGKNSTDTCNGDGGGPIINYATLYGRERAVQYGISSFGVGCGNFPSVYTDLTYYLEWILDNMN